MLNQPIDQFHNAVMAKTKLLGEGCDRWASALGQSSKCQQNLILLGFETVSAHDLFAEVQKLSDAVSEGNKLAKSSF
jgi:hypothetical protein